VQNIKGLIFWVILGHSVEITGLVATVEGPALLAMPEGLVASVATVESRVLEGVGEGTDLVAAEAELVSKEEIVEAGAVSPVLRTAREVALVSEGA
jgi:hypothetical protein